MPRAERRRLPRRTKQHRESIGRATVERTLRRLAQDTPQPDLKHCTGCGQMKPVADFYHRKRRLKSGVIVVEPYNPCRACKIAEAAEHREKLRMGGVLYERRRRYELAERERDYEGYLRKKREANAARERRRGARPRRSGPMIERGPSLPVGPISAFLRERLRREGKGQIAARTGIHERRLTDLEEETYKSTTLAVVDRLLVGLDCPEMLEELYPSDEPERLVGFHVLDPAGVLTPYREAA